jgi:hypothetical protein
MGNVYISPELAKLMTTVLPEFRTKLLADAEDKVSKAKAELAAAETVLRQLRTLTAPEPTVLRTAAESSVSRPGVVHTQTFLMEANGVKHWTCDCESYKFSNPSPSPEYVGQGKSCKHVLWKTRY